MPEGAVRLLQVYRDGVVHAGADPCGTERSLDPFAFLDVEGESIALTARIHQLTVISASFLRVPGNVWRNRAIPVDQPIITSVRRRVEFSGDGKGLWYTWHM